MLKLFISIFLLSPAIADAEWNFGGHAKYQYTYTDYRPDDVNAVFGDDPAQEHGLDLRFKAERGAGPWEAVAHYELLAVHGDALSTRRQTAPLALLGTGSATGLPDDRRRLFDLTETVTDHDRTAAVHRLDRLYLGYSGGEGFVRFGRQALSWGNGLVFHPLDFINPFSPIAVDKDYKTGDDMLYAQWALERGGDVQAIAVPRRDVATHDVESEESTYAAKLRLRAGEFDIDVIGARHFGDRLAAAGLVRSVGGAVWRFDARYDDIDNDRGRWSFVTNLDYSWIWGGRNYYGYVEYFHNGTGEADPSRYSVPNAALAARVARGEVFTLARDYTALGVQVELHPLLNVFSNLIWNLNDGSLFLQIRGVYDWKQNVQLMAGIDAGSGERGDEYGGIPVAGTDAFLAPGRSLYLRAAYYF